MKNAFLKLIGTAALAILMLTVFAQVQVSAQTLEVVPVEPSGNFEGTWDAQVTIRNCQTGAAIRTFASIGTFMSGGTMLDSTSGIPQSLKTPGHGVWKHLTGRTYRFKFKSFGFDAAGNPTGWTIITHDANLNSGGNTYTSAGGAEVYNPNGVLVATICSSTTATRFE